MTSRARRRDPDVNRGRSIGGALGAQCETSETACDVLPVADAQCVQLARIQKLRERIAAVKAGWELVGQLQERAERRRRVNTARHRS